MKQVIFDDANKFLYKQWTIYTKFINKIAGPMLIYARLQMRWRLRRWKHPPKGGQISALLPCLPKGRPYGRRFFGMPARGPPRVAGGAVAPLGGRRDKPWTRHLDL